jgi:hypothetical protein
MHSMPCSGRLLRLGRPADSGLEEELSRNPHHARVAAEDLVPAAKERVAGDEHIGPEFDGVRFFDGNVFGDGPINVAEARGSQCIARGFGMGDLRQNALGTVVLRQIG